MDLFKFYETIDNIERNIKELKRLVYFHKDKYQIFIFKDVEDFVFYINTNTMLSDAIVLKQQTVTEDHIISKIKFEIMKLSHDLYEKVEIRTNFPIMDKVQQNENIKKWIEILKIKINENMTDQEVKEIKGLIC